MSAEIPKESVEDIIKDIDEVIDIDTTQEGVSIKINCLKFFGKMTSGIKECIECCFVSCKKKNIIK